MKAAIVNNNVVVNVIEIDQSNLAAFNAVDFGEYVAIGDTVVNGVCSAAQERQTKIDIQIAKEKRNSLLFETDWWAVSDRTMTQAEIDYRQALRDLPSQDGFPNVEFPVKP